MLVTCMILWSNVKLTKKHHETFVYLIKTCDWNMENIRESLAAARRKDLSRKLSDWFF